MYFPSVFKLLLIIHILLGIFTVLTAMGAMTTQKGGRRHRQFGQGFFIGMNGVCASALLLSLLKPSAFFALITIFSYYLVFTGRRYALNRKGIAGKIDWIASSSMIIMGIIMGIYGLRIYHFQHAFGIVLMVFAVLSIRIALIDLRNYYQGGAMGKQRIFNHVRGMLGATIAMMTAVMVNTIHLQPQILVWLAPTMIGVPVIRWWHKKLFLSK